MSSRVITVENLSKRYIIGRHPVLGDGLRHAVENALRRPFASLRPTDSNDVPTEFWALRDVDLEVAEGEILGVIGRNGAGKSTLLKILSRITEPTTGRIRLRGRMASLLEVGTGFHPELTGRENVFLNGAILGMSRLDIRRRFDQIIEFAGIEHFVDTPVKRYSSGMYVRLAFAVAAHLEPEILIIDEVLAVGDAEFQRKCLRRMDEVAREHGRTVLFVSHNMAAIQNLCSSCVLLNGGQVETLGRPDEVIRHYLDYSLLSGSDSLLGDDINRSGNGSIRLTDFYIEDALGNIVRCPASGMDLVFVFSYEVASVNIPTRVDIGFSIASNADQLLWVLYSTYTGRYLKPSSRIGTFRCSIKKLPLAPGRYIVGARVVVDGEEADWPRNGVGVLTVELGDFYSSGSSGFSGTAPFLVDGEWAVSSDTRQNISPVTLPSTHD